jgi:hypothetical protein
MTEKAPPRESWEGLQQKPAATANGNPDDDTMVLAATSSGAGQQLMEYLRRRYIEHRNRPGASEAELREAEACRRLVGDLEAMRDRAMEKGRTRS